MDGLGQEGDGEQEMHGRNYHWWAWQLLAVDECGTDGLNILSTCHGRERGASYLRMASSNGDWCQARTSGRLPSVPLLLLLLLLSRWLVSEEWGISKVPLGLTGISRPIQGDTDLRSQKIGAECTGAATQQAGA